MRAQQGQYIFPVELALCAVERLHQLHAAVLAALPLVEVVVGRCDVTQRPWHIDAGCRRIKFAGAVKTLRVKRGIVRARIRKVVAALGEGTAKHHFDGVLQGQHHDLMLDSADGMRQCDVLVSAKAQDLANHDVEVHVVGLQATVVHEAAQGQQQVRGGQCSNATLAQGEQIGVAAKAQAQRRVGAQAQRVAEQGVELGQWQLLMVLDSRLSLLGAGKQGRPLRRRQLQLTDDQSGEMSGDKMHTSAR